MLDPEELKGHPLEFFNLCKEEEFVPARIILTQEDSVIFSWIEGQKYAEVEFADNVVRAWTSYGDDEPQNFNVAHNSEPADIVHRRFKMFIDIFQEFMV